MSQPPEDDDETDPLVDFPLDDEELEPEPDDNDFAPLEPDWDE